MSAVPPSPEIAAAGRTDGWSQRWRDNSPRWVHTSQGGFDQRRYDVIELPEAPARSFVARHHYLAGWPATVHRFGLLDLRAVPDEHTITVQGHSLVGVVVLGSPMSSRVLTNVFPDLEPFGQSLEMSRICLDDTVPGNGESWTVTRALHLAAGHGIRGVVTFADPEPRLRRLADGTVIGSPTGHLGIMYQALNARFTGRATPRTLTLLPDGTILTARSAAKIIGRESGAGAVVQRLHDLGASPVAAGQDRRAWLRGALTEIGVQRRRHPGTYRFCRRLARVADWPLTLPGRWAPAC
ncbi:Mom family adenine methylcarbamoylation protein [Kitasatospora purpeofusca]|uniref:Mom family adenine methylcarbamoylation protein n=1 Tax=Kitasatospora purpeofusca TaxID=67352 RepID=UPI0035D70A98